MRHLILLVVSFLLSTTGKAETLVIVTESSPPYHYLDDNGVVSGTVTKKVLELFASAGLDAEIKLYPWARAYDQAKRNPNTFIFSLARTPERESSFHWIARVSHFDLAIVGRRGHKAGEVVKDLGVLASHTFAVQRDDISYTWLKSKGLVEGEQLLVCSDIQCSWKYLLRNVVDFIIEDPLLIEQTAQQLQEDPSQLQTVSTIPELSVTGYLAVNKHADPKVIARLQAAAIKLGIAVTADDETVVRQ